MKRYITPLFLAALPYSSYAQEVFISQAAEQRCQQGVQDSINPVLAQAVDKAKEEFIIFNGHAIDSLGGIWRFGSVETETEPLQELENSGRAIADKATWQRVDHYWRTLSPPNGEGEETHAGWPYNVNVIASSRSGPFNKKALLDAISQGSFTAEQKLALAQAVRRAAVSDTPWSAAFISSIMATAGTYASEFKISARHSTYIHQAVQLARAETQHSPGLYRACHPNRTKLRVGDLICASRGPIKFTPTGFMQIKGDSDAYPSHCDLVVSIEQQPRLGEHGQQQATASVAVVIGGNVAQAVTRRTLSLNQDGSLAVQQGLARMPLNTKTVNDLAGPVMVNYQSGINSTKRMSKNNNPENMNDANWVVLLQGRSTDRSTLSRTKRELPELKPIFLEEDGQIAD